MSRNGLASEKIIATVVRLLCREVTLQNKVR